MPETVTVSFELDKSIYDKIEASAASGNKEVHELISQLLAATLAGSCLILPATATADQLRSMQAFANQTFGQEDKEDDFARLVRTKGLSEAFADHSFRQMIGAILNVAPDTTFWIQLSQPGILYLIQPVLDKREQIQQVATPLKPSGLLLMFGVPIGVGMQQVTFDNPVREE